MSSIFGCGPKHKEQPSKADPRRAELAALYQTKLSEMAQYRDPSNGWVTPTDCDGMIWTARYALSQGVENVNITAAEFQDPGKFGRHPLPVADCDYSWSRDMGVAGLIPYAYLGQHLDILERHAAYGSQHLWQMGDPLGDGRTVYSPALIGLLYKAIEALGGAHSESASWPDFYPSGLTDYQAHLQVMNIFLRGEIANALDETKSSSLLDISDSMFDRLKEHATSDPSDPFFSFVYERYSAGQLSHTLDLLLDPAMPHGSYVRSDNSNVAILANWLWVATLTLKSIPN